jgi:uncharacterized membrane-anchored protein
MLFPADGRVFDANGWAVSISFDNSGHVTDDDAKTIDYDKLLQQMKEAIAEYSVKVKQQGYPGRELIGWAKPPVYDEASKKMFWAKELRFEGAPGNTLNYNLRILGREGVLVLNVVSEMKQLESVEKVTPTLLSFVDFDAGYTYADYRSGVHRAAGYGLAGLVAGGVLLKAAKVGLFAKYILPLLLALKKFIVLVGLAIAGFFKRMFGKKKVDEPAQGTVIKS